ncbi:MAG: hypothetical protein ACUVQO_09470, partial [Leptodesmis sp.]
ARFGPKPIPIHWGESDPIKRGPIIGTLSNAAHRNVIGSHSGSYGVYRALAVASGRLQSNHRADLTNTAPAERIGPHPSWFDPNKNCLPGSLGCSGWRGLCSLPGAGI